ncbi:MAG: prolyl oligopeptidase family serine peptidase [Streptosporangiales bacterium]|nr:prolyl oligopeptidase family serine peptidase [Streptosporangiales bacterium]
MHGDILRPVLDDQVDALHAVAERDGDLDLDRVAIRGWSFSGHLAAAAVLHRPETFHAAVAGAPVTDQRMYDARWKERFAGQLADQPAGYRESSLLPYAANLSRPLLLVHGLLDTNVWSLHTLRLSAALTAAGKPHSTLLLPGQGHRPSDEDLVANLPHLELAFLRQALSLG